MRTTLAVFALAVLLAGQARAQGFSFSGEAQKETQAREEKAAAVAARLSAPCRAAIKGQKIALIIAEKQSGLTRVNTGSQGELFSLLNARLQGLGLATITQQEITARIARAEAEAILNNDPDAALAASHRLGARFFLKGVISARSGANKMVRANEVTVDVDLTLTEGSGKVISQVRATGQSWAGSDVVGAAKAVLEDQADALVAKLYADFCARGGK